MNKKLIKSVVVITMLVVTGVTMSGMVMAQQTNETTTENATEQTQADTSVTKITETVVLKDYEFNGDTVTVWLKADYSQRVVISDMFVSGTGAQKIPQKRLQLDKGMNKVTFTPTVRRGVRGIVIGASGGAVGISEQTSSTYFTSDYSAETLMGMGVISLLTGIGLVLTIAYKKELDYTSDIEREL
ncbi:hypothetical protein [His2 virus]|uniref:Uncharacterized protein n=1 Tax=His 2 virus TaxID=128710 RepID=Q25BD0_HIS2V|nr:hypothetical protein His2V_gp30 [His2 virus]AAQ13810.1 hypothetical protein [His2 virus]